MKNLIVILSILVLMSSCNSKTGITQEGVNQNCEASVLPKDKLVNLLYSKDVKNVQFIDIRTPHQYANGHIPNAINMPMKNFFDKKEFEKIDKEATLILYGEDVSTPKLVALMAGHFTNSKFYIAGGGYDFIESKILNGYGVYSGIYDDEIPIVDFQKKSDEIRSRAGVTKKPKRVKAPNTKPIVKRKKKAVSGGCG